jgi:hypothetical protein
MIQRLGGGEGSSVSLTTADYTVVPVPVPVRYVFVLLHSMPSMHPSLLLLPHMGRLITYRRQWALVFLAPTASFSIAAASYSGDRLFTIVGMVGAI